MKNRLLRFVFTSPHERAMILRSMFWLTYYRSGLWLFPSFITRKAAADLTNNSGNYRQADKALIYDIVRSVRRCSRYVPSASCLTQALAAKTLLNRYGQSSTLRIGVAPIDSTIEAHAWVEIEGKIVLGRLPQQARFSVMSSRPNSLT